MPEKISAMLRKLCFCVCAFIVAVNSACANDLKEIRERGVLRHLGVPYANFVTGSGDGFDVELMQLFAKELGVRYEYVQTNWNDVIGDLIGKEIRYKPSVQEAGDQKRRAAEQAAKRVESHGGASKTGRRGAWLGAAPAGDGAAPGAWSGWVRPSSRRPRCRANAGAAPGRRCRRRA